MGDLYLFLKTFWPDFWGLLPASALLGFDEYAKHWLPPLAQKLDKIPARTRRYTEVLILVFVTFYAGFQAWDEEHKARVRVESALANVSAAPFKPSDPACDGTDKGFVTKHDVAFFAKIMQSSKNSIIANSFIKPFCGMRLNFTGQIVNMVSGSAEGTAVLVDVPPLQNLSCMFKQEQSAYLSRKAEGEVISGTGVINNQNFDGTMILSDCRPGKLSPTSDP